MKSSLLFQKWQSARKEDVRFEDKAFLGAVIFSLGAVSAFSGDDKLNYIFFTLLAFAVIKPLRLFVSFVFFLLSLLFQATVFRLVLYMVYFCVIAPCGLLFRIFNRDPLKLKSGSTFVDRRVLFNKEHFDDPF